MEKIQEFLYDIIGLAVPGILFILICIFSTILTLDENTINSIIHIIPAFLINVLSRSWQETCIFLLVVGYIFGHSVKILSKYQYDLFLIIFDKTILKILALLREIFRRWIYWLFVYFCDTKIKKFILNYIENIIKQNPYKKTNSSNTKLIFAQYCVKKRNRERLSRSNHFACIVLDTIEKIFSILITFITFFVKLYRFLSDLLITIFSYQVKNNNEPTIENVVSNKIKEKFGVKITNWHTIYKIATIAIAQENLASNVFKFLAKYNFHRSLAFIFLLNELYLILLWIYQYDVFSDLGKELFTWLLLINGLLWFTFHIKYKRYWVLCGNDSLLNLFYLWCGGKNE